MIIIKQTPEVNGAHRNQEWNGTSAPAGYLELPPAFIETWERYKPFIYITCENGVISSMVDNPAARQAQEAISANAPPPPPTAEERLAAIEDVLLGIMLGI